MKINELILTLLFVFIIFIAGCNTTINKQPTETTTTQIIKQPQINSFDDCINAGFPILESYPRQCKTPDGKTFVEKLTTCPSDIKECPDSIITVRRNPSNNCEFDPCPG